MGYFSAIFPELEGQEGPTIKPQQEESSTLKNLLKKGMEYHPYSVWAETGKKVAQEATDPQNLKKIVTDSPQGVMVEEAYKQMTAQPGKPIMQEKPTATPNTQQTPDKAAQPLSATPIQDMASSFGISKDQLLRSVGLITTKMGLGIGDIMSPVPNPQAAFMRVLADIDPKGVFMNKIAQDLSFYKRQDQEDAGRRMAEQESRPDPEEQAYQQEASRMEGVVGRLQNLRMSREQEYRDVMGRLKEQPFMKTWYGMIVFVLLSLATGNPRFVAQAMGGADRDRMLQELDRLTKDIAHIEDRESRAETNVSRARIMAAQRRSQVQDKATQRAASEDFAFRKMYLNHQLIKARAKPVSQDAENRRVEQSTINKLKTLHDVASSRYMKAKDEYENATSLYNTAQPDKQGQAAIKARMDQARNYMEHYAGLLEKYVLQSAGVEDEEGGQ